MDVRNDRLRPFALDGNFGLERESLRVTAGGRFAHTPHPYPVDHPRIVRDFCENQTEINTGVHRSPEAAVAELREIDAWMRRGLASAPAPEYLWPFSNPPFIENDDDITPAKFTGDLSSKGSYRDYLAAKYGRYLMAFCGVHVNFSFGESLVAAAAEEAGASDLRRFRDALYLRVAAQLVRHGWVAIPLTAASPVLDASFDRRGERGADAPTKYASVRCGERGYWNKFTPVNDYSGVLEYAKSVMSYVRRGLIAAPSELYYPVRLKPRGPNSLTALVEKGVDHLELRCVDLNPFVHGQVDARDVRFVQLLALWCAAQPDAPLSAEEQELAAANFKNAALFDVDAARIALPGGRTDTVRGAALALLGEMRRFFDGLPGDAAETIDFQTAKLERPGARYADAALARFSDTFAAKGLEHAKSLAKESGVENV